MAERKPNFILIYCDDLGYGDLGCTGSEYAKTPHLDQLAAEGVRFTHWYSNSPVCSPSRAALLTGRYPMRAGVPHILGGKRGIPGLPTDELTLATYLRSHGYRTAHVGKWHLGTAPEYQPSAHGFEEWTGFLAGCIDYYSHIFYWGQGGGLNPVHDLWHNGQEIWRNGRYFTEFITETAVAAIDRLADQPFFLYVAYNAPHYPMHAPQEYLDRFPDLSWDRRIMHAMIACVDDGVGAIVEALKRHGIYEDTVIFFSSDNGPSTESRNWLDGREDLYYGGSAGIFRGHKGSLFEGGIRMPAILSYPRRSPGGQVCHQMGAMFDVFPTFCELAGLSRPTDRMIDGKSIVKMVTEGAPTPHERIFWEYGNQRAVREGDWKLVLNGKLDFRRKQPDPVHLSNLREDPGERENLASQHPELVERLTAAVQEWYQEVSRPREG